MATNSARVVLVGVLKSKRDQRILLTQHWYRIPVDFLPKRRFTHLAFYQPAIFGTHGKRIEYYGRIIKRTITKRIDLLPKEINHPRTNNEYTRFNLNPIIKLAKPIRNVIPRRVSFGFTTLQALTSSRDILELYGAPKTEQIIEGRLTWLGVVTIPEYTITKVARRYRIDLMIRCERGPLAIECDNDKAHASKVQKRRDKLKDTFLKQFGWKVLRFREKEIIEKTDKCIGRILKEVESLGGQK